MLGWFKAIMPKEERFFALFVQHATIVVAGAEALRGVLEGGEEVVHHCKMISERETEADAVTREVLTAVRRTFITPFDRTDIQDLVSSMDDAIDQMNKNAARLQAIAEEIIRIEDNADQLHDEGRKALFLANRNGQGSVMNFIIGTELYDHLESVVDRLEDVSNEINALIVDQL
jgi:uncharacterized protein